MTSNQYRAWNGYRKTVSQLVYSPAVISIEQTCTSCHKSFETTEISQKPVCPTCTAKQVAK